MWDKLPFADGSSTGQYFIIGRVKSVVLGPYKGGTKQLDPDYGNPSDIGKIRYETLYSPYITSNADAVSEPASPIFNFIKQYPVLNEIVLVIAGPSERLNDKVTNQQFFYFPAYNLWNNPNHGAFPNLQELKKFLSSFLNRPLYGGSPVTASSMPLGFTFQENGNVRNLQPFEGDTIVQSRFGQSIRFSSTVPKLKSSNNWSNSGNNGDPITIIINKQGNPNTLSKFDTIVEDINRDGSSIYMTSTQEIFLEDINNFPLKSFGTQVTPISQPILQIQRTPIFNEISSPADQDKKNIS